MSPRISVNRKMYVHEGDLLYDVQDALIYAYHCGGLYKITPYQIKGEVVNVRNR